MITTKYKDVSFNNFLLDNYSVTCEKQRVLNYDVDTVPLVDNATSSTVTCITTYDNSVGNTSFATPKVYEVNDDDIKF